ncbi:TetR family transcriptional regulator [Streptomyces sodiiphilus]|uniref:TetR family transcriptional regulator n=1 Tax=Streptomyces sodiiphilus TaxID=226217 RepID=A0ABN2PBK3_9ACTN
MTTDTPPAGLPLRERKKWRTRHTLVGTALRLFRQHGFAEVTLDRLCAEAEVSKRTFFRYFASKEDVALHAEAELQEAFARRLAAAAAEGPLLGVLRASLIAAIEEQSSSWEERFIAGRYLAARTPGLRDHSTLSWYAAQSRVVEALEERLGADGREDVRLRMLGEFALAAWRCGVRNWVASRGHGHGNRPGHGGRPELVRRIEEAFDALPAAVALTADTVHRPPPAL